LHIDIITILHDNGTTYEGAFAVFKDFCMEAEGESIKEGTQ